MEGLFLIIFQRWSLVFEFQVMTYFDKSFLSNMFYHLVQGYYNILVIFLIRLL